MGQQATPRYVLISACRNEGDYIDALVEMMSRQTLTPLRWILVDDSSTDDTFERAALLSRDLDFFEVVRMPTGGKRSFASQAYAQHHGYEVLKDLDFDFVGFLDADIDLPADYYQQIVERLLDDEKIGVIGGKVVDIHADRVVDARSGSEDYHVAGGVQFFRRQCFDRIGGYRTIEGGGQDTVADIMTMMYGWTVVTVPEIVCRHLRPQGSVSRGVIRRGLSWGNKFYQLGYHPLYYFGQCILQVKRGSSIISSFWQFVGYVAAQIRGEQRPMDNDFVHFLHGVQKRRIRRFLRLEN